ncbi:MAG: molecular chaperone DnaJ [Hyphomicrobium sp.]|nr:molecular chaperone DnaJ [Hyphomicrobium sp.]
MTYLMFGLVALVAMLLVAHAFMNANAAALARQLRFIGGLVLAGCAAVLLLRGAALAALVLGGFAWGLLAGHGALTWSSGWPGQSGSGPQPGRGSRLRTQHLEMELDHDTGAIRGRVLRGAFAGRELDTLSPAEVADLLRSFRFSDPDSAQVLEAYLDQVHPSWREDMEAEARDAGRQHSSAGSGMTRREAADLLGVAIDADADTVRAAHRDRIKSAHPDRGGSNDLAARINEAKSVLLGE